MKNFSQLNISYTLSLKIYKTISIESHSLSSFQKHQECAPNFLSLSVKSNFHSHKNLKFHLLLNF